VTDFDKALGHRLREIRQERGLSLQHVEARSNNEFKASALGCYERGERSLTVHRLSRLAALYGTSCADLLSDGVDVAPGARQPAMIDLTRPQQKTVLVVDDDPTVRELVSTTLKLEGLDTVTAADGVMATELLARLRFDAIVLDTVMPRMDGLTVLRSIREDPATAEAPVLVLSGLDDITHLQQAVEAGATGYLTKPFELQAFVEQIHRLTEPDREVVR
jgi:CheY-like chemotaxis protein